MGNNIWERQESDTEKSYQAFNIYMLLGSKRSLQKAWKQYKNSSKPVAGYFSQWSVDHNWQARVQSYDAYLAAIDLADYEDKRLASRKTRQSIVQGLESFLGRMMEDSVDKNNNRLDLTISELQSIASAAKTIMTESRNEFNDLPTQRKELTGKNGGAIETKDVSLDDDTRIERIATLLDRARARRDGDTL